MLAKKFESISALNCWLNATHPAGYFKSREGASRETGCTKFSGTDSYETAEKLMTAGWADACERVKATMTRRAINGTGERRRVFNSVAGYAPHIPNFIKGIPTNMINSRRQKTPKKVVNIVYYIAVPAKVKASTIEECGAKMFNVVAGLEAAGVRVDLYVLYAARKKTEEIACTVKIKTASQPFNLLKMIYPVVHPSFLRRQMFAFTERIGVKCDWSDYGCAIPAMPDLHRICKDFHIPIDNVFTYQSFLESSEEDIINSIK